MPIMAEIVLSLSAASARPLSGEHLRWVPSSGAALAGFADAPLTLPRIRQGRRAGRRPEGSGPPAPAPMTDARSHRQCHA